MNGLVLAWFALMHGVFFAPQSIPFPGPGMVHSSGSGSITKVDAQCNDWGGSGGTTTFNGTGGNFLVGSVFFYIPSPPTLLYNGSSFPGVILGPYFRAADVAVEIYYIQNPSGLGAGNTISSSTAGTFSGNCTTVWSGMKTSGVYDTGSDTGNNTSSGNCLPGSKTPTSGINLVIDAIAGLGATYNVGSGFTQAGSVPGGGDYGGSLGYQINAVGAVNPTMFPSAGGSACELAIFLGL